MAAKQHQEQFFQLLRQSMGLAGQKDFTATAEDWQRLYEEADRQSLTGVIYGAVAQLPVEQQPPLELSIQWMCEADGIRDMNERLNQESARLTKLFSDAGRRTAILKGPANARLYPDKFLRGPGDIDIWVEGGRDSVLALLETTPFASLTGNKKLKPYYHHVLLPANGNDVTVEVHFRPSSGNYNPFTNKRLQQWLSMEIMNSESVEEGFNVPSVRFALVMQLSHIQRHLFEHGIGLRQVCDYFMLLRNASEKDRWMVAAYLKGFGLRETAGALMWVLGKVFHMNPALMLCDADSYRGEWLLREIMEGGNFGHHAQRQRYSVLRRVMESRRRRLRLMRFNSREVFWVELNYWKSIVLKLPERIRRGRLSLQ